MTVDLPAQSQTAAQVLETLQNSNNQQQNHKQKNQGKKTTGKKER